jgi:hypothetical protein
VWCKEANEPSEASGGPAAAAAMNPACPLASASFVSGAISPDADEDRSLHRLQQMNTITATTTVMQMAELAAMMILSMCDWRADSVRTSRHCVYGTVSGVMCVSSSETTQTMMHSLNHANKRYNDRISTKLAIISSKNEKNENKNKKQSNKVND